MECTSCGFQCFKRLSYDAATGKTTYMCGNQECKQIFSMRVKGGVL